MAVDVEAANQPAVDVPEPAVEPAPEEQEPAAQNPAFDATTGVHYWDEYKAELAARGQESQWDDKYAVGHSDATQFVQPYEGRYAFEWTLKKGQSASEAVQAWLTGLTIAEYRSAGVAAEIDEVRDSLGDRKFDALFGSKDEGEDSKVPAAQRLTIGAAAYTTPIGDQMKALAAASDAPAQKAEQPDAEWETFEREPKAEKAEEVVQTAPEPDKA